MSIPRSKLSLGKPSDTISGLQESIPNLAVSNPKYSVSIPRSKLSLGKPLDTISGLQVLISLTEISSDILESIKVSENSLRAFYFNDLKNCLNRNRINSSELDNI